MASDPKLKPVRWEFDLHELTFEPRPHPLPVPAAGIFDELAYCVRINVEWLPHILGAFQILLEGDSWAGGDDEVFRAQQEVQKLISVLSQPCEESMRVHEFRSIVINERCDQRQWKYTDEDETAWRNDGTPVCDGIDGENGLDAEPCDPCEDGAPGAPGEDCECTDPVPTQPPIVEGDDRCQQACNIAFGLGSWMHGFFNDGLLEIKAGVEAGNILADLVGDLIDAFPVLGAFVDALQDFAINVIATGAEETIAANGEYFKEMIQCKLFCIMADDTGDFTAEYLNGVREELQAWAILLPPQTALLVIIGQIFASWLGTLPTNELLRRANVYKGTEANCDLCEECSCADGDCSEEINNNFVQNPVVDNFGWSLYTTGAASAWNCGSVNFGSRVLAGSRDVGGWSVPTGSGSGLAMALTRNWAEGYSLCNALIPIINSTGASHTRISTLWVKRLSDGVWQSLHCKIIPFPTGGNATLSYVGDLIEITDMMIVCAVGGGVITIQSVRLNAP